MTTQVFGLAIDTNGNNTLVPPLASYVTAHVYAGAGSKNITVPANAAFAIVGQNNAAGFYVKNGSGAAVPAADVTDGTAASAKRATFTIPAGVTTISIAVDAATIITIEWFKYQ